MDLLSRGIAGGVASEFSFPSGHLLLPVLKSPLVNPSSNQSEEEGPRNWRPFGKRGIQWKREELTPASDPNQASRKRKPGQDASHFKTDKSGKLIIDEPSTSTSATPAVQEGERGDAYLANQMAVGGAVRDAKGNLKFNKNTKRGREVEKEYEDTYSGGVLEKEEVIKKKKREVTKLGEEFRSKVSPFMTPLSISIVEKYAFPTGNENNADDSAEKEISRKTTVQIHILTFQSIKLPRERRGSRVE